LASNEGILRVKAIKNVERKFELKGSETLEAYGKSASLSTQSTKSSSLDSLMPKVPPSDS
jgi:hypothetical protein